MAVGSKKINTINQLIFLGQSMYYWFDMLQLSIFMCIKVDL